MSTWSSIRLAAGIVAACLGTLLLALSLPAALAAGAIDTSVGRSGVVSQPLGTLVSSSGERAVVVDGVTARLVAPQAPQWIEGALALVGTDPQAIAEELGDVVLVATPTSDAGGFLGVAAVDSVNNYLDGAPYAVAVRPEGDEAWPAVSVPGTAIPAAPGDVSLWSASAAGPAPELAAPALDGGTLVLMRPDAGPGPTASLRLEYRVAGAGRALETAAVAAAGLAVGGVALIALGGWAVVGRRPSA
jgi:hypothetical protein